ncbi:MAG: hypothetical protein WAW96_00905 [Alphaproteobacteria bacterium]
MRVRTFSGPDMKTVMADVRDALGADAVILSTRQVKGTGFEVQAAVEGVVQRKEEHTRNAEEIAREADFERRLREDLLGVIRTETLRTRSERRFAVETEHSRIASEAIEPQIGHAQVREDGWVRTGTMGIISRRIRAPGAIDPDPSMLNGKAHKPHLNGHAVDGPARKPNAEIIRLSRALEFHGVPKLLKADLLRTARGVDSEDASSALAHALDMRLTFDPIPALPRRPVMLIGQPGAGKTVTAAKLASRAVLLGRGVDIITTDTLRAGAREQMQSFTSILKEELISVGSADELEVYLADLKAKGSKRPCIIDTPGTNPYSHSELKDLRKFVKALDVEPVLVAAAGADAAELCDIAHIFSTLGVQRMIMTRLDAARRLGSILAAADSAKLSLAQFSMTPYIARGLSTMNPMSLARLLLDEPGGGNPRTDDEDPTTPPETLS